MKKNILFIVTALSPENAVGSIRTTKLIKFLVRSNYDVTVISPELHEQTRLDHSFECGELESCMRIRVPQSPLFTKLFLKKRNQMLQKKSANDYIQSNDKQSFSAALKSQFYIVVQFVYSLLRNSDWTHMVKRQLKNEMDISTFDAVFSSYPSLGAHWSSSYVRRQMQIPWIADFRDPLNYETNSNWIIKQINTIIQRRIINKASYVTCISKDMKSMMQSNVDTKKFVFLPNGYDADDLKIDGAPIESNPNPGLTLCYVGSLYGGRRDLSLLFQATSELIKEKRIDPDDIRIVYAGREFEALTNQAAAFQLENSLDNRGFVSREEAISIQHSSDMIIVVTWNTPKDRGILTGKLFECLLTDKMICGIVNGSVPNSEMKRTVDSIHGGIVVEEGAADPMNERKLLKEFLLEKLAIKKEKGVLKAEYNDIREQFSYPVITQKLSDLLSVK